MPREELEIVREALGGDQRAFAELVTRHRLKAWNVCLRICSDQHDAEDAFQSAIALAWRNLGKFRGNSGFGTWFYRIASNASLELVRSRRDVVSLDGELGDGKEVHLVGHSPSFENSVVDSQELRAALEGLTPEAREAIVLFEIAGLKVAEIADHQQSTLSATKVRLHRARKQLASALVHDG
ncbi:RNA polymerase sigma factor [Corynebacterium hansenii]|uniref:RNA polymerase sigma factor n=1 Tax=Corynebacterium hansenii TaxID=394964 RepID=A0ABV7ZSP1_9CORY|nr:sigma-70 family RNA polymerase sigma factor [Corynebacterium hansenii]WJZ01051.1 ECF RNA polymerase sigma factor SigW [Corynebacterium hansenii]